jgi:hypothetical protein
VHPRSIARWARQDAAAELCRPGADRFAERSCAGPEPAAAQEQHARADAAERPAPMKPRLSESPTQEAPPPEPELPAPGAVESKRAQSKLMQRAEPRPARAFPLPAVRWQRAAEKQQASRWAEQPRRAAREAARAAELPLLSAAQAEAVLWSQLAELKSVVLPEPPAAAVAPDAPPLLSVA